jgi:outer membrane protein
MTALRWLSLRTLVGVAGLCLAMPLGAQEGTELSLEDFLARVRATHPQVRQAALARQVADAELLAARGTFDPSLAATWDTKRFKGIGYYDELDARLTIPTPWGVDFKAGWERAAGQIINPERATPSNGLLSAGISIPIGTRILTDERRTALRQAELAQGAADADLDATVARVLQSAARAWGAWAESERRASIAAEGVALAAFRLDALRRRVIEGDAAAIDSVEALAEVERRELLRLDAVAAVQSARLTVEGWLWLPDGAPDRLPASVVAAAEARLSGETNITPSGDALAFLVARHPFVQQATARWRQADAQRRLAAVSLLPSASVEISGLSAGSAFGALSLPRADGTDTKFGGSLRIPLLARQQLGRLRAAEDRSRSLLYERDRVKRDVEIDAERALIELRVVDAQVSRQAALLRMQERLLEAEQQRFMAGESSLLIVNLRERAVLDERLRVAALVARRATALGTLAVALGTPQLGAGRISDRSRP